MNWFNKPETIELSVECIETLGTRDFFDPLFRLIEGLLAVDQCMIFMLDSQSRMSCLLSRNFSQENIATPLAKSYIQAGYQSDPNLQILAGLSSGDTRTLHLAQMMDSMSAAYREQFFSNPGLSDKVSIMRCDRTNRYYINLYRGVDRCSFSDDGFFVDPVEGRLISSVIAQHYNLNDSLREEGPLAFLSDRERQVCRGILAGKKTEAVAADLSLAASSVVTYRRRAYQKLGITSRAALFELCRQQ